MYRTLVVFLNGLFETGKNWKKRHQHYNISLSNEHIASKQEFVLDFKPRTRKLDHVTLLPCILINTTNRTNFSKYTTEILASFDMTSTAILEVTETKNAFMCTQAFVLLVFHV